MQQFLRLNYYSLLCDFLMSKTDFVMYLLCMLQVSDRINCGVYVFSPGIFTAIQDVSTQRKERG